MSFNDVSKAPSDGRVKHEGPGHITSDSLAADSLRSGGSFAGGNAAPEPVPSRSTTANTTSTAGATTLPPAPDNTSRLTGSEARGEYRTPAEAPTQAEKTGNYYSAEGMQKPADYGGAGGGGDAAYDAVRDPDVTSTGPAPSAYAAGRTQEQAKPKGRNLQEGGFSSEDAPNASFSTDIGGEGDPGRVAEGRFQRGVAKSGLDAGYPGASSGAGGSTDQGGFENLATEESA